MTIPPLHNIGSSSRAATAVHKGMPLPYLLSFYAAGDGRQMTCNNLQSTSISRVIIEQKFIKRNANRFEFLNYDEVLDLSKCVISTPLNLVHKLK